MSVKIAGIESMSYAEKAGIKEGETLISINGNEIVDVLDYRFYQVNKKLLLKVKAQDGKVRKVKIKKPEYAEIGLVFSDYLMDTQHSCKNKCIFCFIDQLPKGMRESLYFKDDDSRLSFLFGNYITLTNLTDHEVERIIKMHISPVNISVHTTNPELRCKMMNNRFAGEKLSLLKKFAKAGIVLNCQIVACPGINDGDELIGTLSDLYDLDVNSVAVVPVGLTKYREGLYPLSP
ncbi:MAG: radical SAM protein, partial [Acutalibacteraceae bacterium]